MLPRPSPRITPSTRAGCSCEASRAISIAVSAWSSSATTTMVITMPIAGLPARIRARTNSAAMPGGVGVAECDHHQGLLQVRPSRASIFSADSGPQVPDG